MKQLILCLMLAFTAFAPSTSLADFTPTSTAPATEQPGFFSSLGTGIQNAFASIRDGIVGAAHWMSQSWVGQAVASAAGYIQKGVSSAYNAITTNVPKVYEYAKQGVIYAYDSAVGLFKPKETQVAVTAEPQISEADKLGAALDLKVKAHEAALAAVEQGTAEVDLKFTNLQNWKKQGLAEPTSDDLNNAFKLKLKAMDVQRQVKAATEQAKQELLQQSRQPAATASGAH